MDESALLKLIEKDPWMMGVLKAVQTLDLPDWWIGAGFVRSKVWDVLHNYQARTPLPDIDVIYFDLSDFLPENLYTYSTPVEDGYQKRLKQLIPDTEWSVTNQARMHIPHHTKPYKTSTEALADWSETATCVGVSLINNKLILSAPHGIEDLVGLKLRKIPNYATKYAHNPELFTRRVKEKNWLSKWPKLKLEEVSPRPTR